MSDTKSFDEGGKAVTIRRARPEDAWALAALAAIEDAPPLGGEALVAEVEGELWAARSLADGRTLGDPFRPTVEARALLDLRAAHIARAEASRNGMRRWRRLLASVTS